MKKVIWDQGNLTFSAETREDLTAKYTLKGALPSHVTPTLSWDHQRSKGGLDAEKPHRNYVQSNRKHPGNVSVHIPNRIGAF